MGAKNIIKILIFFFISSNIYAFDFKQTITSADIKQKGYIQVIGRSESGLSEYQAIESAILNAQGRLLEVFENFIKKEQKGNMGRLTKDFIYKQVQGSLPFAISCGEEYDKFRKTGKVCLRIYLKKIGENYIPYLPLKEENSNESNLIPKNNITKNTPYYDGLIIDVRKFNDFHPDIANRILSEDGKVLFDPLELIGTENKEPFGITSKMDKAKLFLSNLGAESIGIINPIKIRNGTDVVIDEVNSQIIEISNRKNSFLKKGRVIFLVK